MYKNLMIRVVSGLLLMQSTAMASGAVVAADVAGGAGVSSSVAAARPMVSVMSGIDNRLAAVYPQTYRAHDQLNLPEDVRKIQDAFNVHGKRFPIRTAEERADLGRLVEWYADLGLAYLNKLPDRADSTYKADFIKELEGMKAAPFEDANRYASVYTIFRSLALASEGAAVSAEMRDVFEKLASKDLFAMYEQIDGKPAWQHSALGVMLLEKDEATPSEERVRKTKIGLPPLANKLFREEKRKQFLRKRFVAIPGADKVGLTMLIRSWLQGVFPIAMPIEAKKAHGTTLPPDYFAHHDVLHSEGDDRRSAALRWARIVLSDASIHHPLTYDYRTAVPEVVQMAKRRFDLLNLVFTKLVDHAAETCAAKLEVDETEAGQKAAKLEYNKTLAAVFYILHEAPGAFNEVLFNHKDPLPMLNYVVKHAMGISQKGADEDKSPTFVNFSGERVKDDAAIKAWVLDKDKKRVPEYFGTDADVAITSSPAFTNIHVTDRHGFEQKLSVMHKSVELMLLEDDAALLKLVGIDVSPVVGERGESVYNISAEARVRSIQTGLQTFLNGLVPNYVAHLYGSVSAHPLVAAVRADNLRLAGVYGYTFGAGSIGPVVSDDASVVASTVTTAASSTGAGASGGASGSSTGSGATVTMPSGVPAAVASVVTPTASAETGATA